MSKPNKLTRILGATQGRIVMVLRRSASTVNDLAGILKLTDNAIRAHLTALEREGLVYPAGERAGVRKPHTSYALTPYAEDLFPKAFGAIFSETVSVLGDQLKPQQIRELMRVVGRRLGVKFAAPDKGNGDLKALGRHAAQIIEAIGGLAELEIVDGTFMIRGFSCPLAEVVPAHPYACLMAEALLSEALGVKVIEHCQKNGTPRCRFEISPTEN